MLVGGGSGGHITPLLAVAHRIHSISSDIVVYGVCDRGSKFAGLYNDSKDIDQLYYISAGKYRRYGNRSLADSILDIETNWLNFLDIFRTLRGFIDAYKLLRKLRPDVIFAKGGFVTVPVGLVAASLGIPYVTHDSDSTPGLANRIIGRWARLNLTGMPTSLYNYPANKMDFVGIPLSDNFSKIDTKKRQAYREELGINKDSLVLTVVGGSLGGQSLNEAIAGISSQLLQDKKLHILHVAGRGKDKETLGIYRQKLSESELSRVRIYGFVDDVYRLQGASDVVLTRAGATQLAELSIQGLPIVIVPAVLAGGHQERNADYYVSQKAAVVSSGQADELLDQLKTILYQDSLASGLMINIQKLAKPKATDDIAKLLVEMVR